MTWSLLKTSYLWFWCQSHNIPHVLHPVTNNRGNMWNVPRCLCMGLENMTDEGCMLFSKCSLQKLQLNSIPYSCMQFSKLLFFPQIVFKLAASALNLQCLYTAVHTEHWVTCTVSRCSASISDSARGICRQVIETLKASYCIPRRTGRFKWGC